MPIEVQIDAKPHILENVVALALNCKGNLCSQFDTKLCQPL